MTERGDAVARLAESLGCPRVHRFHVLCRFLPEALGELAIRNQRFSGEVDIANAVTVRKSHRIGSRFRVLRRHYAELQVRTVGPRHVIVVAREIVSRQLPVAVAPVALHAGQGLEPAQGTLDEHIQVEAQVAKPRIEGLDLVVPAAEHEATVGFESRNPRQAAAVAIDRSAIGLFLVGNRNQAAAVVVGPAMVDAGKGPRISGRLPAYLHAAVLARVQKRADDAIASAADDDRVFAHVGREVVAGRGKLGLVTQEQPGARENPFEFRSVDGLVGKDAAADAAGLRIDQGPEIRFHAGHLNCRRSATGRDR